MHISANAKKFRGPAKDAPEVIEHPERDFETGFDHRVHIRDAKTSRLIKYQPYAKHMNGTQVLFERPIGSGNAYHENGDEAGRWDFSDAKTGWKKLSATHVEAKNPSANPMEDLAERNAALEAELAALKDEKKKS